MVGKYFRIWRRAVILNFAATASSRLDFFTYVPGKLIRMGFFFVFVLALFDKVPSIAGYEQGEVLLFFAVMNFIDIFIQLFWYRGMNDLTNLVRRGDFDLVLTKPISPLFWTSFRMFDFFDLTTIPVAILFIGYAFNKLTAPVTMEQVLLGLLMIVIAFILAFAINLALASLAFWTTETENAFWIYRELFYVARFPPEIYPSAVRFIFTFIIPILVVVTSPTKAILGILSPALIVWAPVAAVTFLWISLMIWRRGLQRYTSASS